MTGELCYASRTNARLHLANLPPRPHRATTRVTLRNGADSELVLERLALPVPHLSLHAGAEARLWTPSVTVERDRDGGLAEVRLEATPPAEAGASELVAPAREADSRNVLVRALEALLG
jgi:hypothetical protein